MIKSWSSPWCHYTTFVFYLEYFSIIWARSILHLSYDTEINVGIKSQENCNLISFRYRNITRARSEKQCGPSFGTGEDGWRICGIASSPLINSCFFSTCKPMWIKSDVSRGVIGAKCECASSRRSGTSFRPIARGKRLADTAPTWRPICVSVLSPLPRKRLRISFTQHLQLNRQLLILYQCVAFSMQNFVYSYIMS